MLSNLQVARLEEELGKARVARVDLQNENQRLKLRKVSVVGGDW